MKNTNIAVAVLLMTWVTWAMARQSINNQEVSYVATGWAAEGLYVGTVVANTSADGCGPKYMIEPNHPMLGEMSALLLSAFHTGTKVNLFVDGCFNESMLLKSVAITK